MTDKQQIIVYLHKNGINFNDIKTKNKTLLTLYESSYNFPLIKTLIEHGMDCGPELLNKSIFKKDTYFSMYLLKIGVNPFTYNEYNDNALKNSIEYKNIIVLEYIVELYPEKINNLDNKDKKRLLAGLTYSRDLSIYKKCASLIKNTDFLLNIYNEDDYKTLLTQNIKESNFDICHFLIDNYYNNNSEQDGQSQNTFELIFLEIDAYKYGNKNKDYKEQDLNSLKELAFKLIDKGANIYIKNKLNESALDDYLSDDHFRNALVSYYEKIHIEKEFITDSVNTYKKTKRL